jgi:dTDP-4-dehydrorhamnose 3,5-epimerase
LRFLTTALPDTWLLEPERHADVRGYFARTWCAQELAGRGLVPGLAQCSVSFNHRRGTLRGMHYQAPPFAEVKLVRCVRGALLDVALDLRPDSPSFGRHVAVELSAENGRALYIPRGFAHGFYTLADASEVEYLISAEYRPEAARGVRFDDPRFGLPWPGRVEVIAPRDRDYPDSTPAQFEELRGL